MAATAPRALPLNLLTRGFSASTVIGPALGASQERLVTPEVTWDKMRTGA